MVIVILRLLLSLFPSELIASQVVNLTDNLSIGVILLVGWAGVFQASRSGFQEMWQQVISMISTSFGARLPRHAHIKVAWKLKR